MVAALLQEAGWYVVPSYDYAGDEKDKAPKLQGNKYSFVIPDLDISRAGNRLWAEVKTKREPTEHRVTKRVEHGIPLRHFQHYQRVQEITGCPVWLFVVEESSGDVLCGKLDELTKNGREYNGNKMSNGGMIFFLRGDFKQWGRVQPL